MTEGKLSLFQPSKTGIKHVYEKVLSADSIEKEDQPRPQEADRKPIPQKRIRTTIDLTSEALVILQQVQQDYRLKTGRVLPIFFPHNSPLVTNSRKWPVERPLIWLAVLKGIRSLSDIDSS